MRPEHNFCYVTGTNRNEDTAIIRGMVSRAREAGVSEDIHVFAPLPVSDTIFHQFTGDWKKHMAKIDFMLELANTEYDYFVWIDADTWFVRDPGNLSDLIRDEKCWVSMESDFHSQDAKFNEWYGLFVKDLPSPPHPSDKLTPNAFDVYKSFGAKHAFNTNGGMFIVRRSAVAEFHQKTWEVFNKLHEMGFHNVPDEPPLAIVGDVLASDPLQNTFEQHKHRWACDWHSTFAHRLPDGKPWAGKDWLTQTEIGPINPDIVHLMRGKHLLQQYNAKAEPVGTKLHEILSECGVESAPGCSCKTFASQMDQWGVQGCQQHRKEILTHLAEASDGQWLSMMKVAACGFFSCGQLLDESIKRAQNNT